MIEHLLPNARAWRVTSDKSLRQFFVALSSIGVDVKEFVDLAWGDAFPATTRDLDSWEDQFALPNVGLSESERRERLDATWKALGGQDRKYIEDTLRAAGFDVYVHEWWIPGTEPAIGVMGPATARNPFLVIRPESTEAGILYFGELGEVGAQLGEAAIELGNQADPPGYPLVNKLPSDINYLVPADTSKWPYILYIGGLNFGDVATVLPSRRDEFETLCLKICPTQQWLGMIVTYS